MKRVFVIAIVLLAIAASPAAAVYSGTIFRFQPQYSRGLFLTPIMGWLTNDGSNHTTSDGLDGFDMVSGIYALTYQMNAEIINPGLAAATL